MTCPTSEQSEDVNSGDMKLASWILQGQCHLTCKTLILIAFITSSHMLEMINYNEQEAD